MGAPMIKDTPELRRMSRSLQETDPAIAAVLHNEVRRQATGLELIASENFVSEAVMETMGSVLTNKYAEGYPGKRYYGGCEFVDHGRAPRHRSRQGSFSARSTPTCSRTPARRRTWPSISTVLQPGDTVLGMNLAHGGHLTHGHPLNFSGKIVQLRALRRREETETIDYDELDRLAREHKPKLIVAGASAYPRIIDFPRMRRDRAGGGRAAVRGHGAHRRPGRRRPASQPGAACRLRHHDHAQDAARPARRPDSLPARSTPRTSTAPSSPACRAAR